ncbi:MAG: hypothetical protein KAH32_00695 [Chlamydiia bacterium]|nr:hypothetical protein [Chlamydiia bacterium]
MVISFEKVQSNVPVGGINSLLIKKNVQSFTVDAVNDNEYGSKNKDGSTKQVYTVKCTLLNGRVSSINVNEKTFLGMQVGVIGSFQSLELYLNGKDFKFKTVKEGNPTVFKINGSVDREFNGSPQFMPWDYKNYDTIVGKENGPKMGDKDFPWAFVQAAGPKTSANPIQDMVVEFTEE